ncbi:response regulator transcription factor, partial [Rhodocaloribacter sp.]
SRAATVLVVEDNAELRAYLREHLQARYRVVEAEDGREGLEKAQGERPDLVVSDVMMPRMDGFALLRALKRDDELRTVPVLLLTARAGTEDRLKGLGAQADDYLAKPFHMAELEGRIANLIAMRRAMRRAFGPEKVTVTARALELPSEAAAFLAQAQEVIESHVSDRGFNVQALAEALYVSKRALERRMREMTGHAPAAYIRQVRLARARQLLEGGQVRTVREASQAVGFGNQGYFARLYRKAYGQSPAALVRQGVEG